MVNDLSMAADGLKIKNAIALVTTAVSTPSSFTSLLGILTEFRAHTVYAKNSYNFSDFSLRLVSESSSQRRLLKGCYFPIS